MSLFSTEILTCFPLLQEVAAFQAISHRGATEISSRYKCKNFSLGQFLCKRTIIPSEILLITKGQARLLGVDQDQVCTLEKLGPGSFVGLASLLRAAPCEEVIAASELEAIAFSDDLILKLLTEEESFSQWCSKNLFTAELADLLSLQLDKNPVEGNSLLRLLSSMKSRAHLFCVGRDQLDGIEKDQHLIVASQNIPDCPIGTSLRTDKEIPLTYPPLPARLVVIPDPELFQSSPIAKSFRHQEKEITSSSQLSSSMPLASGIDLGQSDHNPIQLKRGKGSIEVALACFYMLSKELNLPFRRDAIEKILTKAVQCNKTIDLSLCGDIFSMMGLHVSKIHAPASLGKRLERPSLVAWKKSLAVVGSSNAKGLVLASPRDGWVELDSEAIEEAFPEGIEMLLLERKSTSPEARFGFAWFWPALKRYRNVLTQVLVASFVVQLFSLANPLLIQVIIDKVINQRSLETLQVLGIALVVVTLMEGIIGGLRTFLFSETTNRIDMRLGSQVVDHLMRLPSNYFDKRSVGELGTRVAELEKIRSFLTGQTLSTLLDTCFSVVYIVVMLFYSWLLTLLALCVLPIQIGITVLGAPLFRRQYRESARENARAQSYLNESLTGIQTVKAQNIELISRWKWQDIYKTYISKSFKKNVTGTVLSQSSQVLQKLSQILVLWAGAGLVLNGQMSLGQLIAFRIISGYVTQPLLRLSNTWQSIQELKVSLERIADVIDTPEESNEADRQKIPLPIIKGDVRFEDVGFSFESSSKETLNHVSLHVEPGTFVGIVGKSGSGKSTFAKMLSRLYSPNYGKILIDEYDIEKVELYSLRSQIGIVPQETFLFKGTVSENIAFANPDISNEEIVRAARIACAHDFIMELADGYSSYISERGSNLSGGQRQRIALARTLISQPRILVLDEATSALDYQTEQKVCKKLLEEIRDNTIFFITHRLQTVRNADLILLFEDGRISEKGTHDQLISKRGHYWSLYNQQRVN